VNPEETQGVLNTVKQWTGEAQVTGCPWNAFRDPFVHRVLNAYRYHESGGLDWVEPSASHRLVEGVTYYAAVANQCAATEMELERKKRAANG